MTSPPSSDTPKTDLESAAFDEVTNDISDVKWTDYPALLIFWVLFFIVALQFFTRYVLNDSLAWTEEIARFFLIFLAYIGSITCVRKGSHIYLEFFYRYLPVSFIKPLAIVCETIVTVFFSAAGYYCIGLAQRTLAQRMISVDLPKGIIYWVVVVACFAMAVTSFINILKLIKRPAADIAAERLGLSQPAGS
ncbi:TRAP transporter small permease [Granulosicoccus antarcticus]|uniref:TRAP transporter small permease protein n=1 Tax=Granulosicoccus antarcticus IMCC3135 TaxID=1192854 RepID=A0A2Z2NWI6_9GAMM|nr:TRAP transporter small permease [Granulosicoccus antarcticus]ASJ74088.1 Sialic acid TRAP transporter small permease protein SiaQ [Granulosicoccus antarcticus IMCC3135]